MAYAVTYEEIRETCQKSERRMILTSQWFYPIIRTPLIITANQLIQNMVPKILAYLEKNPAEIEQIRKQILHLHSLSMKLLQMSEEKSSTISSHFITKMHQRLEDCLECIEIASDAEIKAMIDQAISECKAQIRQSK